VDRLSVTDVSPDLVRLFLKHVEDRPCSIATRNQRLAAIHALARFVGEHSPEHIAWCSQIRLIPFKRTSRAVVPYLSKPEVYTMLASMDRDVALGCRDHAVLLFLYNSGARASEVAQLKIGDLDLSDFRRSGAASVKILGKGGKTRYCPLWPTTATELMRLTANRLPSEPVFLNRRAQPMTRFGIYKIVGRYAKKAGNELPSINNKRVSPHTMRHTAATHLLRGGVDINTVREWLGHVSLDTTNIYAEVDLEMKAQTLAKCAFNDGGTPKKPWRKDPGLMAFLRSL
jgi:integrase/recombinase XerD